MKQSKDLLAMSIKIASIVAIIIVYCHTTFATNIVVKPLVQSIIRIEKVVCLIGSEIGSEKVKEICVLK